MERRAGLLYVLLSLLLFIAFCAGEIPGGDTVELIATSYQYPFHFELQSSPRAIVEVELNVPPPPLSCFTQDHNATNAQLWLFLEEDIMDELGLSNWVPLGDVWSIPLKKNKEIAKINHWNVFKLPAYKNKTAMRLTIATTCDAPIAVRFELMQMTIVGNYQEIIGGVLLVGVYVLIITEVMHRTLAAMLGAFMVLVVLTFLRERPPIAEVIAWIDEETIGLLIGMMIIVGIFSQTGFFEWIAVKAFKMSKGYIWRLVAILCILTIFLSAFIDNVTTMLLLAPVTLRLAGIVNLPPEPFLLAEIFYCNIGGASTMIGDPPNIILGSVLSDYVGFLDFIINLGPGVVITCPIVFVFIWFIFRKDLEDRPCSDSTIADLEKQYNIHDMKLFIKSSIVLGCVILMFFMELLTHVEPAWIALAGAAILLLISSPKEIDEFLEKVEWSTLLFFAGLFILVEGIKLMGLIRFIGDTIASLVLLADEDKRVMVAMLLILWISAFASAFIDNIPYTTTMIPVILQLAEDPELKLPLLPLAWALAFAGCYGGNGTLVASSANVVTCSIAAQAGYPISFGRFFKTGMPVMIVSMVVITAYMLVVYIWLGWGWGSVDPEHEDPELNQLLYAYMNK